MFYLIFLSICIFIYFLANHINNSSRLISVVLSEPVKLKYVRQLRGEYHMYFYNPIKKEWWEIPKEEEASGFWSFYKKGNYRSLSIFKFKVQYSEIDKYNDKFKTLADIQALFDKLNKNEEEKNKLQVIYNY